MREGYHIGRHWPGVYTSPRLGQTLEEECPCPVEACGLVAYENIDPNCPQHSIEAAQTIRSSHPAKDCPGARK